MSQDGSAEECVTFYVCVTLHLMCRGALQYINHSQDFLKNVYECFVYVHVKGFLYYAWRISHVLFIFLL